MKGEEDPQCNPDNHKHLWQQILAKDGDYRSCEAEGDKPEEVQIKELLIARVQAKLIDIHLYDFAEGFSGVLSEQNLVRVEAQVQAYKQLSEEESHQEKL